MQKNKRERHLASAERLLNIVGSNGHIQDILDVMVRGTVKKSTDMALVRESLSTPFKVGSNLREQDPDFIDIAAAIKNRYTPLEQIAWLLEVEVPWGDIRNLLNDAIANIKRAEEFLKAFQARETSDLSSTEREYLEQRDFCIDDLNDQFELELDEYVHELFQRKISDYCNKRVMNWNIVHELVKERASVINKRGPVEQVALLFRTGYSEQDLISGFEHTLADQKKHTPVNRETPEP